MNMTVTYCRGWAQGYDRIVGEMSEDEARRLFKRRKPLSVVVGHPVKPWCFLDVSIEADFVGVGLLDNQMRVREDRGFRSDSDPIRMFLGQATFREFVGKEQEPREAWVYTYRPDGSFTIHFNGGSLDRLMAGEGRTDLSAHWAPAPVFGEWEPYYRVDRVIARPTLEDCTRVWNIPEALEKLKAEEAAKALGQGKRK